MSEEILCLSYDVFSLPTAQHRAGLAGLLVLLDTMQGRKINPLPQVENTEFGVYQFHWTKESLRAVLNEFYDATMEERPSKTKRSGQTALKEEVRKNEKTGKDEKLYYYEQLAPKASFFRALDMHDIWMKLWCNALWQVLRAQPATRKPFDNRQQHQDALEIDKEWQDLAKFQNTIESNGQFLTASLSGCYFIGSQAHNAEKVAFRGRVDENFLLHFWPIVMGVYQPNILMNDGKMEFQGYVLVIPDVLDVEGFKEDYKQAIGQLSSEVAGYRPKDSIISIHHEGGLAYAWHLMKIASAQAQKLQAYEFKVSGVETYHLKREGNNVYMLASDRLKLSKSILEQYERIVQKYTHPIFKRQLIVNLLENDRPWYRGFDNIFSKMSIEHFIGNTTKGFTYNVSQKLDTERSTQ
ncbi:MAG: type I-MYXAN CRISPR-associated protein Cmx8 [Cyanobacteria bacterium]|nr:type I-MYXAN CRISPR-associated protein Cmx8 [Cyanobacteriota bacterium]